MKAVISLCDLTGNFVRPWADAGFPCWCVDVQHLPRVDRVEGNIHFVWGDARSWCPPAGIDIAFVAAFPPCTDVAGSGARDWQKKGNYLLTDALELWSACQHAAEWSRAPYLIENPVGALSRHMRKPDHIFHPWQFTAYCRDDHYTKKTCLWTGGGFTMPERRTDASLVEVNPDDRIHKATPGADRSNFRSATPMGFARAVFEANCQARMARAA